MALEAHDRLIGLKPSDIAVDGCIAKAPRGGEKAGKSPVDRGKRGIKRSTVVDADGVSPLGSSPLRPTATTRRCWMTPSTPRRRWESYPIGKERILDRGYDSGITRRKLGARGPIPMIAEKGKPAPLRATKRWVIERTNSWHTTPTRSRSGVPRDAGARHRLLDRVLKRGHHRGAAHPASPWARYRWETRPSRRP